MIHDLEKLFKDAANPELASRQSAYMRNLFPFLGITKPQRELLEKGIFKTTNIQDLASLEKLLLKLWKQDHREFHYTALCLAQRHRKLLTPKILPTLEKMIRTNSWWDTVDTLAPNLVGHLVKTHPELAKLMDQWIEDPYLWIRRAALLHQLRWKEMTDEEILFKYCQKTMHEKEFFIRKAIGWVLREYSKTNPRSVKKFIAKHQSSLSPLSIREGSKYI
ncbi:MAG TPA: DNA alkylation repair protein [Rhabdochlamydiaceae bacterium]|nr:DNA alkylation repair protein [Rhabdochlamydiaceae bacterium]